ncbi:hypothetical protein D3C76_948660 [compost metagenome]
MAWPVLGVQRLQQIGMQELTAAGESMGIKPATARTTIAKLVAAVRDQAQALLLEVEQENAALAESNPEIRATLAGEMRLLRAIVSIVIVEMTEQFSDR